MELTQGLEVLASVPTKKVELKRSRLFSFLNQTMSPKEAVAYVKERLFEDIQSYVDVRIKRLDETTKEITFYSGIFANHPWSPDTKIRFVY